MANGQPCLILGDGAQTMDFVFVTDIARANLRAAQSSITDDVLNIASGTETSLTELADAARSRDGRRSAAGVWARAEGDAGLEAAGGRQQGGAADRLQGEGVARRGAASAGAVVVARSDPARVLVAATRYCTSPSLIPSPQPDHQDRERKLGICGHCIATRPSRSHQGVGIGLAAAQCIERLGGGALPLAQRSLAR